MTRSSDKRNKQQALRGDSQLLCSLSRYRHEQRDPCSPLEGPVTEAIPSTFRYNQPAASVM
ncbi:hypothetical protein [Paenibacillus lutrae]|uniref:Uncharacterized protein n=1 Tax=Paenibacillus lutrae TaxID=2078573 RepID=A0A7X3JXY0_9BACL|nr:hypothetical protein [Paenibacillus lutrae]MVO98359.1 hypothetical protein [Paenibacillus lutrae]